MPAPSLTSRLLNTPLVTDAEGRTLYEIRQPMEFRPIAGIRKVTISGGDTIFHVAAREYGNAQLWWAIADWNGIFDPTTEFTPGRVIQIPPESVIDEHFQPVND